MFKENKEYNKTIKQQIKNYLKTQELIQNKTNKLLNQCNTHGLIGTKKDTDKKIKQLGGTENLIGIGGGGLYSKLKKVNLLMV